MAVATFGAGCFWGVEAAFARVPGVRSTKVGYAGGRLARPTYHQVCSGQTGHAEVVQVDYDPDQVGYPAAARGVLGGARPDPGEPSGAGRRQPVPLGDLRP